MVMPAEHNTLQDYIRMTSSPRNLSLSLPLNKDFTCNRVEIEQSACPVFTDLILHRGHRLAQPLPLAWLGATDNFNETSTYHQYDLPPT